MSGPSPEARAVATRVIGQATRTSTSPEEIAQGVDAVCARLQTEMTKLLGAAGVRALAMRALHLTRQRCTCVGLGEAGDGALLSTRALVSHIGEHGAQAALACASLFLAQVTSLLARFIGDDLTNRLLSRSWPDAFDASTSADAAGEEALSHERK